MQHGQTSAPPPKWATLREARNRRRGRPPKRVPDDLALTRRITHRDPHGWLLSGEVKATIGALVQPPGTTRVERLTGVLRDRLNALTCRTHAFAKTSDTWDALLGLAIFEYTRVRPHPALRHLTIGRSQPHDRRVECRTPATALGLADRPRTWLDFLRMPTYVSRWRSHYRIV